VKDAGAEVGRIDLHTRPNPFIRIGLTKGLRLHASARCLLERALWWPGSGGLQSLPLVGGDGG
jgi:hypothetical protein